jgi:hypothetical protein
MELAWKGCCVHLLILSQRNKIRNTMKVLKVIYTYITLHTPKKYTQDHVSVFQNIYIQIIQMQMQSSKYKKCQFIWPFRLICTTLLGSWSRQCPLSPHPSIPLLFLEIKIDMQVDINLHIHNFTFPKN